MAQFAGLDVSVKETSVCVVDDAGTVHRGEKLRIRSALAAPDPLACTPH
jgi:hypothetical protein